MNDTANSAFFFQRKAQHGCLMYSQQHEPHGTTLTLSGAKFI